MAKRYKTLDNGLKQNELGFTFTNKQQEQLRQSVNSAERKLKQIAKTMTEYERIMAKTGKAREDALEKFYTKNKNFYDYRLNRYFKQGIGRYIKYNLDTHQYEYNKGLSKSLHGFVDNIDYLNTMKHIKNISQKGSEYKDREILTKALVTNMKHSNLHKNYIKNVEKAINKLPTSKFFQLVGNNDDLRELIYDSEGGEVDLAEKIDGVLGTEYDKYA